MRLIKLHHGFSVCLLFIGLVFTAPSGLISRELETSPAESHPVRNLASRGPTCNTATNRACWMTSPAFNVNTNYETSWPTTGTTTRTYTFTLTEVNNWVGGDGRQKVKAMLVNGQFPGPTITADWGDRINVTVINNLVTNGTSIHWHGLRQLNNNINDGVGGVTECPIPPGGSKTYSFIATQYGTSWYHSHTSVQSANGVLGPIVINGPASSNYDIDLGPFSVADWYYGAADAISIRITNPSTPSIPGFPGSPPPSDNILFNGKNINPSGPGGAYQKIVLTPNKIHRLRIINPSVDNTFTVSLVGHSFTIIATDFVPVTPKVVTSIYLTVGQRYDVLITSNQPVGNYWFNVTYSTAPCGLSNNPRPAAIFQYTGAPNTNPTNPGTAPPDTKCADRRDLVPIVSQSVPLSQFQPSQGSTLNVQMTINNQVAKVFWPVNNSPMNVSWNNPTLDYVRLGTVSSMPAVANVVQIPTANIWSFWLIQNNSPIPHPMHLHGHDFLIVGQAPALPNPMAPGQSLRAYNDATDRASLNSNNPTRRDTTVLPSWGWLVVAFNTNNPGAWLFHCHTAWHAGQGLSIQYLEQLSNIPTAMSLPSITPNCNSWRAYYPANDPFRQHDSGI